MENQSKSKATSAEKLPGHYYRPDGMPYGSKLSTYKRKNMLAKEGIATEPVEVGPNEWALQEVDRQSTAPTPTVGTDQQAEQPSVVGPAEKVSGESTAKEVEEQHSPSELSGDAAEMVRKRTELSKIKERIALEEDLAAARSRLTSLKEGAQGADKRESIRREGDPGSRPRRKGLHRRNVLMFPKIPGMETRVVNDTAGGANVQTMIEDGWQLVGDKKSMKTESDGDVNRPSQVGSSASRHVGMDASGKSVRGVLMMIPTEIYNERIREQQREIDELERTLAEPPAILNRSHINVPGNPNLPAGLNVGSPEPEADVRY